MEREIERFRASADDGTVYTVVTIQELVEAKASGQAPHWIKGLKRLELDDGSPVNYIDPQTFKIVATNQLIRKV